MEAVGGTPHQFVCPISLQPMQDPVTAPTGITYDRPAIERWLAAGHASCPVTGQPLSLADLTPNHTLRRLIEFWHSAPLTMTAAAPVERRQEAAAAVVERLMATGGSCPSCDLLREAAAVASESGVARRCMVDAGVLRRVLRLVVSCAKKRGQVWMATGDACLALFHALDVSGDELRPLVADNHDLVDAVTRMLTTLERGRDEAGDATRASAVKLLESVVEVADASLLERMRPELFRAVTAVVRDRISPGATRAALRMLLHACPVGRNRALIVEAGAAHEAIELELAAWVPQPPGGRRATELVMALLAQLCACADGRAAVASHPAGIAVVAKRLLRVSAAADACAVRVLAAVAGRAASPEVLREMARVGAVGKLCCVLQADCDAAVKETARAVLKMHSGVWSGSPCVSAYLLFRYL
ncbi:hypothetical protein GUJ93_ZPchr0009g981 [Zizania palustris]|uniref:U-box domain-containing protein n=1 Tax=Zizania palustris TaxID=103762 RepID=A0A8J5R3S6_ZIZPA|nr:hypothetical protein GUJ93_ZPchr0009g981 [Zizania palustris]